MGVKFENVDILESLRAIMELHTKHYQEDYDLDSQLIQQLALSDNAEAKRLLWMSRPCGTHCLPEQNVYLQDSYENKVWMFYHEQTSDPILAYAIHLKGQNNGHLTGDIYSLDYAAHAEKVKLLTCPIAQVTLSFADGAIVTIPYAGYARQTHKLAAEHGKLKSICFLPESSRELEVILRRERFGRERNAKAGDFQEYLAELKSQTVIGRQKTAETKISRKQARQKSQVTR